MSKGRFNRDGAASFAALAPKNYLLPVGLAALMAAVAIGPALAGKKQPAADQPIADVANGEPMTLVVSLSQQKVDVYRGTTLVTSNAVSTGMPGHATKAGVFSILEKQRWHHSNIYSGAPMPWMNRITWSGTALHAGVVPGYPASHGCIRLTYSFAPRLYQITTVGDNVVVAQGRPAPTPIEHPNLFQPLPPPTLPVVAKEPEPEQHSELDSTGPGFGLTVARPLILAKAELPAGQSETADHGAQPEQANPQPEDQHAAAAPESGPKQIHAIDPFAGGEATTHAASAPDEVPGHALEKAQAAGNAPSPAKAPVILVTAPAATVSPPAAAQQLPPSSATLATASAVPAEAASSPSAAAPAGAPSISASKLDAGMKAAAVEAAEPRSTAPIRILITRRTERDRIIGVQDLLATMGYLDRQDFDGTVGKPTVAAIKAFQKANGMKETGTFTDELVAKVYQVAGQGEPPVGHIFVRQQFSRLFDAPVSFKDPDQPLGTHLYTVQKFAPGDTKARWTAVTLSGGDPASVLDRLEISDDLRQRISERLTPGSSLIIADLSINSASLPKGGDFVVWTKDIKPTAVSDSSDGSDGNPPPRHRSQRRAAPGVQPYYYDRRPTFFGQW